MEIVYISGSPRRRSNTDYLLKYALSITGGQFLKLTDFRIEPCKACRDCRGLAQCLINDDMNKIRQILLNSDGIVLGSPVYFNSVSAQLKTFMDRTYCLIGRLKNKIGGAIVVGRRYGAEGAISTINAFFLKHEMIPANRGVYGIAFKEEEIMGDEEAIEATRKLAERLMDLGRILKIVDSSNKYSLSLKER